MIRARTPVSHHRQIKDQAEQAVEHVGQHVGHQRPDPREQQKMRRVGPDVPGIAGTEFFRQQRVVGVGSEIRRGVTGQCQLSAEPRIHEVAADVITDGIVGQGGEPEIAEFQSDDDDADGHCELEERVDAGRGRGGHLGLCRHGHAILGVILGRCDVGLVAEIAGRALRFA